MSGIVAFTDAGHVAAGWLLTGVTLAGYAVAVIRRGRRLSGRVPPEERRWS